VCCIACVPWSLVVNKASNAFVVSDLKEIILSSVSFIVYGCPIGRLFLQHAELIGQSDQKGDVGGVGLHTGRREQ
jgi:hypothetical protein